MPLDPFAISSAISGLITGISGEIQKHKARKLLGSISYPTEGMPSEVLENQQIARRMANTGLPQQQYNKAYQDIYRNQNTVLGASSDRRGGLMGIGNIQQRTNDALLGLDVADANARIGNQKTLLDVNNQVAAQKRDLFNKNIRQKYLQNYNYGMQLLGAGNQNFTSGLDNLGAAGLLAFGGRGAMGNGSDPYNRNRGGLYNYMGDSGYSINNDIG